MAYLVRITARAERDFTSVYEHIRAEQSIAASRWYEGFRDAILSLKQLPQRCPVTREKDSLRHRLYGRKPHIYRVIFRILEEKKVVQALHIRHGARRKFTASDLQ